MTRRARRAQLQDEFDAAAAALKFTSERTADAPRDAGNRWAEFTGGRDADDSATGAQQKTKKAPEAPRPRARKALPERTLNTPFRRFAAATASVAAVGAVAVLAVGVALPLVGHSSVVEAGASVAAPKSAEATSDDVALAETELQGYVAGDEVETAPLERVEGYEAATFANIASAEGISTSGAFFHNDPTADIQWPFAVGTSMSSPFGYRWGRLHEGVDFTPGDGAPVQAIADGVVRTATEAGGAYGVSVYIDHVIDGQLVTSHYAHMQYGSLQVVSGQRVEVGDIIGNTGNTGRSYGSHMHFEIRYNDTAIDPLPWLNEHANRHYTDEEEAEVAELESDLLGADFTE